MGCDIHLYIERKNREGIWEHLEIDERLLPNDRNYELFGFLAGVRGHEHEPQFAFRGIPEDSSLKGEDLDIFADHSITHAYLDEILAAPWQQVGLDRCYFYVFCSYVLPLICDDSGWLTALERRDVRILIGFDS